MPTADEYADWIIQNRDKRGTPEFDTVKQAYLEAKAEEERALGEEETTLKGLTSAAIRGASPIAAGAALGAAAGAPLAGVGAIPGALAGMGAASATMLLADPIVSGINAIFGTEFSSPTEALQTYFTELGLEEPDTAAERIVQMLSAGGAEGAGQVAGARALAQMGGSQLTREVGEQMAQAPVEQIAGAAAGAGAAQTVAEAGGGPAAQLAAGVAGGAGGGRLAGTRLKARPESLPADIAEAESLGIPVMTTDVVPPTSYPGRLAQSTGEKIPVVGTGPLRAGQQEARVQAVRDFLEESGVDAAASASDDVMRDLQRTRGAQIEKYTGMKNDVISRLSRSDQAVPVDGTVAVIDQEIAKLQSLKSDAYAPAIAMLEDWKQAIQGQSLENIELLRKQIGESFKAPELGSIRDQTQKALNAIYAPLRQEMRDYISIVGEPRDLNKWEVANRRLRDSASELQNNLFKTMLNKGEVTPEIIDRMIFSAKPSDVRLLYKNLSPEGRASAQLAILQRAAKKAVGVERLELSDLQTVSPEKFISELKRLGPSVDAFFTGEDLQRVKGLIRALDLTRRAPQSVTVTKTGEQVALPVITAYLGQVLGAAPGLVATGGLGVLARVYESKPVRNALLKLPQVRSGSDQELELMKVIIDGIRAEQLAEEQ